MQHQVSCDFPRINPTSTVTKSCYLVAPKPRRIVSVNIKLPDYPPSPIVESRESGGFDRDFRDEGIRVQSSCEDTQFIRSACTLLCSGLQVNRPETPPPCREIVHDHSKHGYPKSYASRFESQILYCRDDSHQLSFSV